jgi:hypothetical protein
MNKTTTLTPAFVKKIHKAHTTTTRFNWRVVGTSQKATKSVRFVLQSVPKLLKDWTKLYRRSNNGTFKTSTKRHSTRTRNHRNTRNTRTTTWKRTHRTTFHARNRFAKNTKRTSKNRFATHTKRFTNRKRHYRTRRAA